MQCRREPYWFTAIVAGCLCGGNSASQNIEQTSSPASILNQAICVLPNCCRPLLESLTNLVAQNTLRPGNDTGEVQRVSHYTAWLASRCKIRPSDGPLQLGGELRGKT